jgi:hypothetical protein
LVGAVAFQLGNQRVTSPQKQNRSLLRRVSEHPILNITVGFLLMATGLLECLEPLYGHLFHSPFGVHHGAALFGMVQFMKWLPDVFKGLQFVEHGDEEVALEAARGG